MNFRKLASLLLLVAGLAGYASAQTALTQTTLAAAVTGPALYNGNSVTIQSTIFLTSTTGLSGPVLPGTPSSIIYVGREAMGVFQVNTTLNTVVVNRGYLGTTASPHPNGEMVLYGPNYAVTLATGGNPLPNGLFQIDPPQGANCTAANTPTTPWVNVLTGAQWLCSSITNTWVPGFNNALAPIAAAQTATVPAAAGAVLPSGPLFVISGAGAITGFTVPVGCDATAVGGCQFTVISAAGSTWTWTAAGNIMTAGTGTAGHTFVFTWSASLQKFVPSALS